MEQPATGASARDWWATALVVDARDCVWCGAGHERHLLTDGFQVHGVFLEEMFVQGFLISFL